MRHSITFALSLLVLLAATGCPKKDKDGGIEDVPVRETLTIPNLTGEVQVVLDEYERPHVYADNEPDLMRVIGYMHARDRFLQMDFYRRASHGRLAELAGGLSPGLVDVDFDLRVLGITEVAQAMYDAMAADDPMKINVDAYTEGVNVWVGQVKSGGIPLPLEYNFIPYPAADIPEWDPVDTFACGRLLGLDLSWDDDQKASLAANIAAVTATFGGTAREGLICDGVLNYGMVEDGSIVDPTTPATPRTGCPYAATLPVTAGQAARAELMADRILKNAFNTIWAPDRGSNNWVVGPDASATGFPMVANDPHLGLSAPSIWYQVHYNTIRNGGDYEVQGVTLPGVPTVLIGHNGRVAWGSTNVGPDVSDNYVETYLPNAGAGPDQIMFDPDGTGPMAAAATDLVERTVTIKVRSGNQVTDDVRTVLDHPGRPGAIIPGTVVENPPASGQFTALSWRWIGFQPTTELFTFDQMARANNHAEVLAAIETNRGIPVAAQHLVWVTADGDIGYKADGLYPIRDDNDGDPYTDPAFLPQPGDGSHEWTGFLDTADVPQVMNPALDYFQTANQDPSGNVLDGDPLNGPNPYIGFNFDLGHRGQRIQERLAAAAADGGVTIDDMMDIQGDHQSPLGRRMTPFILTAISGNSTYQQANDLLQGWSDRGFIAASGAGPQELQANEVEDAAATALFNVWLSYFQANVLNDELGAAGIGISSQQRARILLQALETPADTFTYDATAQDSILFDDFGTGGTTETRTDMILTSLDEALVWLAGSAGFNSSDPNDWMWGELHTLTLDHPLGVSSLGVPTAGDPEYGGGFPHHGDNHNVDAGNPGITNQSFDYGSGPSMRQVIHAEPGNFRFYQSFPGGASGLSASEHYDNQMRDNYIFNGYTEFWFHEPDVAKNGTARLIFQP